MKQPLTYKLIPVILLLSSLLSSSIEAQQNGGLELWSPSGSPPPFDWKFPTGWTTNNATTEFITAGVNRTTDAHRGSYAAEIKTLNIFGTNTRSQLALGHCLLDYPRYQVLAFTGGEPLPMIPQQVSFFYKLTVDNPDEYAVADILIKHPSGSSFPDTVFYQSLPLQSVDVYSEVIVPISQVGINTATDSIVILFSSNDTNEVGLNLLYVDDVSIDFTNAINTPSEITSVPLLYPNPIHPGETLRIHPSGAEWHNVKMIDSSGRCIETCSVLQQDGPDFLVNNIPSQPGLYCLIVDGRYGFRFLVLE